MIFRDTSYQVLRCRVPQKHYQALEIVSQELGFCKGVCLLNLRSLSFTFILEVGVITLNGPWNDFVPVKFCKLLNAPADRMVEKTLKQDFFRRYYITLHTFSRNIDLMSQKSRKRDKKIKKNSAYLPFFQFSFVATLSHWYQDWVKVTPACFETC